MEEQNMVKCCIIIFALISLSGCLSTNCMLWRDNVNTVETKKMEIDGIELSYEEYGNGELVLFIHGFGASSYSWRHVARALACDGWRCVSLDLMGFGCSAKPPKGPYTLEKQAELVGRFAHAIQAPSVHLVGHSYGGAVCLFLLSGLVQQGYPELEVRSLILTDTVCYPQEFPGFIKLLRTPFINWVSLNLVPARTSAKSILELCYYSKEKITEETILEYASGLKQSGSHEALVSTARQIIPSNMEKILESYGRIDVPTLLIWGDHDRIIPLELGKRLLKEIPSASIEVFKKCGHIPQEEYPEETTNKIRSFLETIK